MATTNEGPWTTIDQARKTWKSDVAAITEGLRGAFREFGIPKTRVSGRLVSCSPEGRIELRLPAFPRGTAPLPGLPMRSGRVVGWTVETVLSRARTYLFELRKARARSRRLTQKVLKTGGQP